jgi:hypothetical protein
MDNIGTSSDDKARSAFLSAMHPESYTARDSHAGVAGSTATRSSPTPEPVSLAQQQPSSSSVSHGNTLGAGSGSEGPAALLSGLGLPTQRLVAVLRTLPPDGSAQVGLLGSSRGRRAAVHGRSSCIAVRRCVLQPPAAAAASPTQAGSVSSSSDVSSRNASSGTSGVRMRRTSRAPYPAAGVGAGAQDTQPPVAVNGDTIQGEQTALVFEAPHAAPIRTSHLNHQVFVPRVSMWTIYGDPAILHPGAQAGQLDSGSPAIQQQPCCCQASRPELISNAQASVPLLHSAATFLCNIADTSPHHT